MWKTFGVLGAFLSMATADWVDLWEHDAPGAERPPAGSEEVREGDRYTNIETPQYKIYQPENPNGVGVVIFPGGGYRVLAMSHEGKGIGEWCTRLGVTAMIVKYRVSESADFGYQFPVPLLDARRAIRTMRTHAEEWGLDAKKIGVMGSSAGGHLASMCLTLWGVELSEEVDDKLVEVSCRPDFGVLVYPVISIGESWSHGGSGKQLLGETPSEELLQLCSTQRQVTKETPPVYVVHAADDRSVPLRNAAEFMSACAEEGVPVTAEIFPTGGHGFGWRGKKSAKGWIDGLEKWLLDFSEQHPEVSAQE